MVEKEKCLEALMQGKNTPQLYHVSRNIGEDTNIEGDFGIKLYRDENDKIKLDLVPPLAIPEFESPEYKQLFLRDEKSKLAAGDTLNRLISMPDPHTGKPEFCYVGFDKQLNRFVTVPNREVEIPDYFYGSRLNDTQKDELKMGGRILCENCKINENTASLKVQYDVKRREFVGNEPKYNALFIPEYIKVQLNSEQKTTLENFGEIDARNIKKRDGTPYPGTIGVSKESNTIYFGFKRQEQSKEQSAEQSASTDQSRSAGRKM